MTATRLIFAEFDWWLAYAMHGQQRRPGRPKTSAAGVTPRARRRPHK